MDAQHLRGAQKILESSVLLCVECHVLVLLVQVHASIVV
jgi:hypothetical protein